MVSNMNTLYRRGNDNEDHMKKNANDSEIFHTILQKMTSISWQYICHQRRLISSESYSLAQEVNKKFLKDFFQ